MVERVIKRIISNIVQDNGFNKDEAEQMEYTLKVFSYEIIKLVLLILLFTTIGYGKEASLVVLVMAITKPFIGGYHEDSQIRCFVATVLLALFIIILSTFNGLNIISILTLSLLNVFSIYHRAPIINEKMPIKKENIINRNRKIGIVNVTILSLISIFLLDILWSTIIIWTITIQTMLMFNKRIN